MPLSVKGAVQARVLLDLFVFHRKVEICQHVINSFPPVPTTGSKKAIHVLCLYNNACKRSLAICHKSRALCPVSGLLPVPIQSACAKQGC